MASLAVYRVSRMIADEEGPGLPWGTEEQRKQGVFTRLRGRFPPTNWIGRGLECILCVSFWVALPFAFFLKEDRLLAWPALSAVTVVIRKWEQKR